MKSAWLTTELETYERHVELDSVGQAAAIREAIRHAVQSYGASSFLYLGCAGGNGLESIGDARVVGLDLNENFLVTARERWGHLPNAEFVACNLDSVLPDKGPFGLAFGALVFEYVHDLSSLIRQLAGCIDGRLVALLLATRENAPAVSESPYREALQPVGREFRYLSADDFVTTARESGFVLDKQEEIALPAGKHFVAITLKRRL